MAYPSGAARASLVLRSAWSAGPERLALVSRSRHWRGRLATLAVAAAALVGFLSVAWPWHDIARLALTALVLLQMLAGLGELTLDLRRVIWERLGRFAWLRHAALAGGVLLVLACTFALLVFLYPDLARTPIRDVAVAILLATAALVSAVMVFATLAFVFMLLALPVLLARTIRRRRQRRAYAYPYPDR